VGGRSTLPLPATRTGKTDSFRSSLTIYFRGEKEREGNLWKVSLKDRSERPVTNLVGKRGTIAQMQPSTDGRFIYFPWQDDLADIWVMDVAR
jgi:hypothetical protein